jgi:hypothetical protein
VTVSNKTAASARPTEHNLDALWRKKLMTKFSTVMQTTSQTLRNVAQ